MPGSGRAIVTLEHLKRTRVKVLTWTDVCPGSTLSCLLMEEAPRPGSLLVFWLLLPWDFPGKSTGVGCPCFLHIPLIPCQNSGASHTHPGSRRAQRPSQTTPGGKPRVSTTQGCAGGNQGARFREGTHLNREPALCLVLGRHVNLCGAP